MTNQINCSDSALLTAKAFNSQQCGSYEFTPNAPGAAIYAVRNEINRNCSIHGTVMINVQHPLKPAGVIVAQYCPECQKRDKRSVR